MSSVLATYVLCLLLQYQASCCFHCSLHFTTSWVEILEFVARTLKKWGLYIASSYCWFCLQSRFGNWGGLEGTPIIIHFVAKCFIAHPPWHQPIVTIIMFLGLHGLVVYSMNYSSSEILLLLIFLDFYLHLLSYADVKEHLFVIYRRLFVPFRCSLHCLLPW